MSAAAYVFAAASTGQAIPPATPFLVQTFLLQNTPGSGSTVDASVDVSNGALQHIAAVSPTAALASAPTIEPVTQNLWPFLIYGLSVVGLLAATLTLAWLWGLRTPRTDSTDMPFESGVVPVGSAEETRLSIEFYLIAMFFVIFDLETIFIFAWAVAFFELGWTGYLGASAFIVILLAALVYEWRTGALDWGVLRRQSRRDYSRAGQS